MASTNIQTFPGKVGVSNTNPIHTLDIGSNVYIDDTAQTKLRIIGNIHASGVTVDGTITAIDSENLSVKDPIILLASGSTGTSDTGIIMKRADGDSNVAVFYDEGVGLKIGHTLSTAQDIHISVDSSNSLSTSIYGPVTVAHSSAQALVVQGGAEIADDFKVGASKLFVDVSESNVGIGTNAPLATLDVHGTANVGALTVVSISGDGSALSSIQSSNVSDFASNVGRIGTLETDLGSNVTRIGTLETDLGSNVTRIGTLETDLGSNVTRITNLESSDMTIGGEKTFSSNLTVGGDVTVTDTTSGSAAGPEFSLYRNQTGTNGDYLGQLRFDGKHDGGNDQLFGKITGKIKTATSGNERGIIETALVTNGTQRISVRHSGDLFHIKNGTDLQVGETANLYVDTATSRVGIGMSNPSYTLDVDGDINLSTGSTLKINGTDAVFSNWTANGSDIYRSSGNVGIGTASPAYKLDVHGTSNVGALTATSGTFSGALVINGGPENNTTPALSIRGGLYDPSDLYVLNTYNTNTGVGYAAKVIGVNIKNKVETDNTVQIRNNVGGVTSAGAIYLGADDVNQGIFGVLGGTGVAGSTLGEYLTVKANGNVGIGTTSPSGELHVRGENMYLQSALVSNCTWRIMPQTGNSTKLFRIYDNDNSADRLVINASGNVGIGTNDPKSALHVTGAVNYNNNNTPGVEMGVHSSTYAAIEMTSTSGNTSWVDFKNTNTNADYSERIRGGAGHFEFHTNTGGERMRIDSSGNVGIGLTGPESKLHIYGSDNPLMLQSQRSPYPKLSYDFSGTNAENFQFYDHHGSGRGFLYGRRYTTGTSANPYAGWHFYGNGNTLGVRIDGSGNVGIGITNPTKAKLQVEGHITLNNLNARYYNASGASANTTANRPLSFYANRHIACQELQVFSDRRIKKNIVDADDAECLETLRLFKPKRYNYKDRGEETVWGFIAQEVRDTLPYATSLMKDVVPNIYELVNVSSSNVITFTNFNTSDLDSNATTLIRTIGIDDQKHDIHLAEVIDEHTIRVEEDLTDWIGSIDETGNVVAGHQLFIYGQEVDDFVSLNKSAIWTVATAALQEVDRQLQAEKAKVTTLETQLADLLARVQALEAV